MNEYDEVIQDTGTGGSWPISTDRLVWSIAAWEIYLANGDPNWLVRAETVLSNTVARDAENAIDRESGLLYGETQYKLIDEYFTLENGLYSLYLYPAIQGNYPVDKTGTLSNSLAVLFQDNEIGDRGLSLEDMSANLPVVNFGIPTIYPQQPQILPYHNAGIWPFVEAYFGLAAVKERNGAAYEHTLQSMSRSAALFLSHMENMVYDNGHSSGTQINSERQLWSVAGYLGMIYKGLFGIGVRGEGIEFSPIVPDLFEGEGIRLANYTLRNLSLNIEILGSGSVIQSMTVNGETVPADHIIPWNTGEYTIVIEMKDGSNPGNVNMQNSGTKVPQEPRITGMGREFAFRNLSVGVDSLLWTGDEFVNPESVSTQTAGDIWSILAVDGENPQLRSNLSHWTYNPDNALVTIINNNNGKRLELLPDVEQIVEIPVTVPAAGRFYVSFNYTNGSGPINTDNKNAIRSLYLDETLIGAIILPQRGDRQWGDVGLSSGLILSLPEGDSKFVLKYRLENRNMNVKVNRAFIESMVLIPLK